MPGRRNFGAAALRVLGFPPLIFDLEADQDTDHVVAIFKVRGHWGAVAKSNFSGCRYREPVYRTLRELAMSYFNIYFNLRGERTLRRYSRPVNLARFDRLDWMTTKKPIWFIAEHLCEIPHISLLTPAMEKNLTRPRSAHDRRNGRPPKEMIRALRKKFARKADLLCDGVRFRFQRRFSITDRKAFEKIFAQKWENSTEPLWD